MTTTSELSQTVAVPTNPSGFRTVALDEELARHYGVKPQLQMFRRKAGNSLLVDYELQRVPDAHRGALPSVRLDDGSVTRTFNEAISDRLRFSIRPEAATTITIF